MKQYIMGMLTGASLILCAFMFMGASASYYDIDDVYTLVNNVQGTVNEIEYDVSKIRKALRYGVDCN